MDAFKPAHPAVHPENEEAPDLTPPRLEPLNNEEQDDELDYWTWRTRTQFKNSKASTADPCLNFPTHLLRDVQIVLKTGTADNAARTKAQVETLIKCITNAIVVSDTDHPYGPDHQAQDVLARLLPKTYLNPEDFVAYESQKIASRDGKPLDSSMEGWKLDKYKFLPEIELAVEQNPSAKWYMFVESDTYVFWDNLFRLVDTYNYTDPWYFGSPSPGRKDNQDRTIWFAYGGAGFLLSANAAQRFTFHEKHRLGEIPRVSDRFREDIRHDCCGDSMLGWAMHEKLGLDVAGLWPMFNPHPLRGIPFSKLYWCEPVLTLHKTIPEEFNSLYQWEDSRDRTKGPLLYADLISHLGLGDFSTRDDWDNANWDGFSPSDDSPAHSSFKACKTACAADDNCFQFTYHMQHCYMAKSIRLGEKRDPEGDLADLKDGKEEDRRFMSGWDTKRIKKWVEDNKCEAPHWVKPSIKRIF
ncbi:hypothetical protein BCR34DRAFT_498702 [Clohesyomyces aquaticus]|uniref:N-acetylgalactosaminide beta-1,3-galactosyltransferase n=1 Tax=Clohesyomyces aquaticus TaxID=1231657 RepID=A0A1Y1YAR6_9PLEO|nr:hypothetical protein BCR34DRAFT_498702 [Clohesyomyces aquaticus]